MAISIVGGLVKIGRGVVKIIKGAATGDGEEVAKGVIKVAVERQELPLEL